MFIRRFLAISAVASLALAAIGVSAATLKLNSSVLQTAIDGGTSLSNPYDGGFVEFEFTSNSHVSKQQINGVLTERRTALEFNVPAVLRTPGIVIQSATLTLNPGTEAAVIPAGARLELYRYIGNGQADVADYNLGEFVGSIPNTPLPLTFDVLGSFQPLPSNATQRLGFVLNTNTWGASYSLASSTSLVVQYTLPANNPPNVTINSPVNGSTIASGVAVTLSASTSDDDGDLVNPVAWNSSVNGALGTGSPLTVNNLSTGAHVITAIATDSTGLSSQATVSVTVSAPPPPPPSAYCAARGNNASYEWIRAVGVNAWSFTSNKNGGYGDFTASPPVPVAIGLNNGAFQPGFMSSAYPEQWRVWIDLNRDNTFSSSELLFSGASSGSTALFGSFTVPLSVAAGTTRMRVAMSYGSGAAACGNFSYGEVEDYVVDLGAVPPAPPPPTYCSSSGNTTSEWISQIQIAGVTRYSGRGSGYSDFTSQAAIPLLRAPNSNSATLTPGFPNITFWQHWRIWIDYNRDGVFGDDEVAAAPVESPSTINTSVSVPATAPPGTTRMRVSMRDGNVPTACGTIMGGEVEDYTVSIPLP